MAEPTEDSPVSGPWVKVQPRRLSQGVMHMPDGPPVWIARENLLNPTGNTPAWSQFPLKLQDAATAANGFPLAYSRVQLDALDGHSKAVDDRRVLWWRITFCKPDGEKARGWVCGTGHPNTKWESPWAWPGFEIVDATGINLADAFKRNLIITDSASWKEKKEFEPFAATVNNSPLLLKLEELVARQQPSTPGGKQTDEQHSKVTAKAIQASMRMPALAQALSHVILKYESEWGGNMSRWDAITPIMRNAKANWMKELERVGKLQWWKEVEGRVEGFPVGAIVHHIHPVALVANFGGCPPACKTEVFEFKTTEGIFRVSKKSFRFILSNEGYRDYPYVPSGDQSSGVTIGYGYDLGQQSSIQIANDLNGIFSLAQIIRLQSAVGKHGDQARHIQPSLADIRVTMDMALRLAMIMKRRYAQQTVDAFPGVAGLHPHCSGALLDLVINRGPGMQDKPGQKTRSHMRAIRAGIGENRLAGVPLQLRAMKTLWDPVTQGGLLTRRDAEADLFEQGMNCCCWS